MSRTPDSNEVDAASFVLTVYGRINGSTYRGDRKALEQCCHLFFRI